MSSSIIYIFQILFLTHFFPFHITSETDMWTQIFCSSVYLENYFNLHGLDIFIFFYTEKSTKKEKPTTTFN